MWTLTLFFLRLIARAGLSLALLVWLLSERGPFNGTVTVGVTEVSAATNRSTVTFARAASKPTLIRKGMRYNIITARMHVAPDVHLPGVSVWANGLQHVVVQLAHWLLCLFFLIMTVATSWRRKKPDV